MSVSPKVEYKLVETKEMHARSHQYLSSQSVLTANPTFRVWLGICSKGDAICNITVL